MADPVTWALIGSAVVTAAAGTATAVAAKNTADAQAEGAAKEAQFNADQLDESARIATDQAASQQAQQQRQARQVIAAQRAALIQGGVTLTGSAEDALDESRIMSQFDKLNIDYEGQLNARGLKAQSAGQKFNLGMTDVMKKTAKTQFGIGVVSSIADAGSTAYTGWARRQK